MEDQEEIQEIPEAEDVQDEVIYDNPDMALAATVVYDGIVLMYEWLPVEEAKQKIKEVLGRDKGAL